MQEQDKIVLIDHFDSFTYNLVDAFFRLGVRIEVVRTTDLKSYFKSMPRALILGPGPGGPEEISTCRTLVRQYESQVPILGICLGHQCLVETYGGQIVRARKPMHGKLSPILHLDIGLFKGLPQNFLTTRYHSLAAEKKSMPEELVITAISDDGEVMGVKHKHYPIEGVQFHPESIASQHGLQLLNNFLKGIKNDQKKPSFSCRLSLFNSHLMHEQEPLGIY